MKDYELEHPDITSAQETGYARSSRIRGILCQHCGNPVDHAGSWYAINGLLLCSLCIDDFKLPPCEAYVEDDEDVWN